MTPMTKVPTILMGAHGPVSLVGKRLTRPLDCLRCSYNLQGGPADGVCPECGLPIPFSLAGTIDPVVHRLPPLRRPQTIGRGVLSAAAAIAVLSTTDLVFVLADRPVGFEDVPVVMQPSSLVFSTRFWCGAAAALVVILAAWSWWCLRVTQEGPERRWLPRWILVGLLLGAGGLASGPWFAQIDRDFKWTQAIGLVIPLVGLGVSLAAYRGVLVRAGQRSQAFRRAHMRRQRIPAMLAGIGVAAAGWCALSAAVAVDLEFVGIAATVVALSMTLLVAIGAWYLLVNAWWISGDLRSPPPRLDSLLEVEDAANLAGADRPDPG